MKYFLIAGEASGDLHASHLIAALRERDAEAVPELIASDMNAANVTRHLHALLDGPARASQLGGYALVRQRLATLGAPQRAAAEMVALLKARQ